MAKGRAREKHALAKTEGLPAVPQADPTDPVDPARETSIQDAQESWQHYELLTAQLQADYAQVLARSAAAFNDESAACNEALSQRLSDAYQRYHDTVRSASGPGAPDFEAAMAAQGDYVDAATKATDGESPGARWKEAYAVLLDQLRWSYSQPDALTAQQALWNYAGTPFPTPSQRDADERLLRARDMLNAAIGTLDASARKEMARASAGYLTDTANAVLDEEGFNRMRGALDTYLTSVQAETTKVYRAWLDGYQELLNRLDASDSTNTNFDVVDTQNTASI